MPCSWNVSYKSIKLSGTNIDSEGENNIEEKGVDCFRGLIIFELQDNNFL